MRGCSSSPLRRAGAHRSASALVAEISKSHTFTIGAYRRCYRYDGPDRWLSQQNCLVNPCTEHEGYGRARSRHSERTQRKTFLLVCLDRWWYGRGGEGTKSDERGGLLYGCERSMSLGPQTTTSFVQVSGANGVTFRASWARSEVEEAKMDVCQI